MKKFVTFLLIFALLIPIGLSSTAGAESVTEEPFYGLGWHDLDTAKYPYLDGLVWTWFSVVGDQVTFGKDGSGTDMDKIVAAVKKEMDARPAGTRYLHIFRPAKAITVGAENRIYLDNGVAQMKALVEQFLEKYKAAGGLLEGIILDVEYIDMGAWYIYSDAYKSDPLLYKKIVDDPRYATQIRPLLVEHGFVFYKNITDYTPEIYSLVRNVGEEYANCERIWNTVIRIHLNRYVNQFCYEPLMKYFPDATLSDYQSTDSAAWEKGMNDSGNDLSVGGNSMKVGNVSNYNFYACRPGNGFYKTSGTVVYKNPVSYNEAVYEASAFNMFLYDANLAKRIYASTDSKMLSFWIARYDYYPDREGTLSCTPYYAEQILHLGMMDPEPFLVFMPKAHFDTDQQYDDSSRIINDLMAELTRVAGFSDRKPIEVPQTWNSEFVLSGMYANGRNIWRITPNTDEVSVKDFLVEGKDPTFRVAGQTVTFPGGKIIETGDVSIVGTCGYWVETAANVRPIVTSDVDRFEKNPAYVEDFESYKNDTELTANTVRHKNAWFVERIGSAPYIAKQNGNSVLTVSDSGSLKNTLLPENITAGDSWAKEQLWSVTVTLPNNLNAKAELILLKFIADQKEKTDLGFKINGGKVYYNQNGTYAELKGLDVSKGGKFIFKRVLHCVKAGAYSCDYYVCDETGKELAGVQNVLIPTFTPPVTTICIEYKKLNSKVLLDDYTLRAVGATTEVTLYDADSGVKITDVAQHRQKDTAYRLSWMNASAKEETATLKADFYKGTSLQETKVIGKIKMAPGSDGVETGIVEVPDGQSVKVYIETTVKAPATPTLPTEPSVTVPGTTETKAPTTATKASTTATKAPTTVTKAPTTATKAPTAVTKAPVQATLAPTAETEITEMTQITGATAATEQTQAPTKETEVPNQTLAPTGDGVTDTTISQTPEKPEKKGGGNVVLIVVIVAVILATIGTGVYFFVIKKKKVNKDA